MYILTTQYKYGEYENPNSMERKEDKLILQCSSGTVAKIEYERKNTHITFELI
jgi:hypothetical protein